MNLCRIAIVIVVAAALLIPTVAAQEIGSHNYIVTPAGDAILEENPPIAPMNSGSIVQDETDWYSTYVAAGTTELIIDLNWGGAANSLRLTVHAPDAVLGPYYDAYDGVNGRIYLRVKDYVGLHPGIWRFEIYGDKVAGIQDYTFVWR